MKPPHSRACALLVLVAASVLVNFGIGFRGQAALGQKTFAPEVRAASDVVPPALLRGPIINWAPRSEPLRFEPAEASLSDHDRFGKRILKKPCSTSSFHECGP
jgi:hypothetical protein